MARHVLEALRAKPTEKLTATQVARACGVCSAKVYDGLPTESNRVRDAVRCVRQMLSHFDDIGWANKSYSRGHEKFRLVSRAKRAERRMNHNTAGAIEQIAKALAIPGWDPGDTYIAIRGDAAPQVLDRMRALCLVRDDGKTPTVRVALYPDQARVLLDVLDASDAVEGSARSAVQAAIARTSARVLGEADCSACYGLGEVHHEDVSGRHSWRCERCGGAGVEPDAARDFASRREQRRSLGYTCAPTCLGIECDVGPLADLVPAGFVEVIGCTRCGLFSDRDAALRVGGDRALWVDELTGARGRVAGGGDEGLTRVAYVVPEEDAVACDLALPGDGRREL